MKNGILLLVLSALSAAESAAVGFSFNSVGDCLYSNGTITFVCLPTPAESDFFGNDPEISCLDSQGDINKDSIRSIKFMNCKIERLLNKCFDSYRNVQEIDVSNMGLKYLITELFANLSNLESIEAKGNALNLESTEPTGEDGFTLSSGSNNMTKLDLSSTEIRELPARAFQHLKNLEVLKLTNNHINKLDPESFSNLSHLRTIDLSSNEIETIPARAFQHLKNLEVLDLSNNNIDTLHSDSFSYLKRLRGVNLSDNKLTEFDILYFVSSFFTLKVVSLENNQIQVLPPRPQGMFSELNLLNLAGNKFQLESLQNNVKNGNWKGVRLTNKVAVTDSDECDWAYYVMLKL